MKDRQDNTKQPNLLGVLLPYRWLIGTLIALAFLQNGISLLLPTIIARGIDAYGKGVFDLRLTLMEFAVAMIAIFLLIYAQNVLQTYASERAARDLRKQLSAKISSLSYAHIQEMTPAKLLTNLTSDIDAIKTFISQAIVSIASSLFLIVGISIVLLLIDWQLALVVLTIVPLVAGIFFVVFRKVRMLFLKGQEVIDWLNKVINESILGAALIRVLHGESMEQKKFGAANASAQDIGMQVMHQFAILIPTVGFLTNIAVLIILVLGGHFAIRGTLSLGNFAAFNTYVNILIFPIVLIGFMSTFIARAAASYNRVRAVLDAPEHEEKGTIDASHLRGDIALDTVSLSFGEKIALKNVSFLVKAGTKTAIIGPTAAGKTQLLYLLTGLQRPTTGTILFDGHDIADYDHESLHHTIGFVFQDTAVFSLSLRDNIAFSSAASDDAIDKAIETAELSDFIQTLPQGLDTLVSERGTSLSGGQKQRMMLARALALNPSILLLDDFTARVDTVTEKKIIANLAKNYPDITLVSVTQKISSIEDFDHIILLMEGEILAQGKHEELMASSPEYVQIYESQRSTNAYELRTE